VRLPWAVALAAGALVAAGCVAPPATPPAGGNATAAVAPTNATGNATAPPPLVGERGPVVVEHLVLLANHTLGPLDAAGPAPPATAVPETNAGTSLYTGAAAGGAVALWEAPPASRPFEIVQDVAITLRFASSQAAVSTTRPVQFPPVGGWLGTKERWNVEFAATDAPDTLQPGTTYVVRMVAKAPPGGLFVRQGERLALRTFLSYQTADGSQLAYVVGGAQPAGLDVPHVHFDVAAPGATVLLDKRGAIGPNPSPTTTQDPQPTLLAFDVPPATAFVAAELVGTPTSPQGGDADLALLAGSRVLGEGTGPTPHEVVVLGPGALALAGGKLVAKVAGAMAAGGTFHLVVTAYGA
jgi:hypothetical protein